MLQKHKREVTVVFGTDIPNLFKEKG